MEESCPHEKRLFKTMNTFVDRTKIGEMPKPVRTYPHRETCLECHVFSIAYDSIVSKNSCSVDSIYLFPDFAKVIGKYGQVDSNTLKIYKKYGDTLKKVAVNYGDFVGEEQEEGEFIAVLPKKFNSHGIKKNAVNFLSENSEFQVFVFSCGWMVKNIHSAFDYIFQSMKKDNICGKLKASWIRLMDGTIVGGYPPNKDGISHKKYLFEKFANTLFDHENHYNNEIKEFLTCNVLRWLPELKQIMRECPSEDFDIDEHIFLRNFRESMFEEVVFEEDVKKWHDEIYLDYIRNNHCALPIQVMEQACNEHGYESIMVDNHSVLALLQVSIYFFLFLYIYNFL